MRNKKTELAGKEERSGGGEGRDFKERGMLLWLGGGGRNAE
jgi:hypothetical protein